MLEKSDISRKKFSWNSSISFLSRAENLVISTRCVNRDRTIRKTKSLCFIFAAVADGRKLCPFNALLSRPAIKINQDTNETACNRNLWSYTLLKCFIGRKLKISFDAIKICMIYDAVHFVSMDICYNRVIPTKQIYSCNTIHRLISQNSFLACTPFSHYFSRVKNYKLLNWQCA